MSTQKKYTVFTFTKAIILILLYVTFQPISSYAQTARIGNKVWEDSNKNGLRDSTEVYLDNVTLKLYQDDGNGVFDITEDTYITTTTTSSAGTYYFENLAAGDYWINVIEASLPFGSYQLTTDNEPYYTTLVDGWYDSEADFGYYNSKPLATSTATFLPYTFTPTSTSSFSPTSIFTATPVITIPPGVPTELATLFYPTIATTQTPAATKTITGMVWRDQNCNNIYESGELGINNILILAYQETGDSIFSESTDTLISNQYSASDGHFQFNQLGLNVYYITINLDSIPKDVQSRNAMLPIKVNLASPEENTTVNFGFCPSTTEFLTIKLEASVQDKSIVAFGEQVTFTVTYKNNTTSPLATIKLLCPLTGSTYVAKSMLLGNQPLSDDKDNDVGHYQATLNQLEFNLSNIAPGSEGTISFKTTLNLLVDGKYLYEQKIVQYNSIQEQASKPITFGLNPYIFVTSVTDDNGNTTVPGDTLTWTISVKSKDSLTKHNLLVGNALPDTLVYIEDSLIGKGAGIVNNFLAWKIGDLAPDQTTSLSFKTKIKENIPTGTIISNQPILKSLGTVDIPSSSSLETSDFTKATELTLGGTTHNGSIFPIDILPHAGNNNTSQLLLSILCISGVLITLLFRKKIIIVFTTIRNFFSLPRAKQTTLFNAFLKASWQDKKKLVSNTLNSSTQPPINIKTHTKKTITDEKHLIDTSTKEKKENEKTNQSLSDIPMLDLNTPLATKNKPEKSTSESDEPPLVDPSAISYS